MAPEEKRSPQTGGERIEWFTVRYRTLSLVGGALVLVAALAAWFVVGRRTQPPAPVVSEVQTGARFASIEGPRSVSTA